jgi:hypothetical protein
VITRPLWRVRLTREAPRYLLAALAAFGIAASARFAISPPLPATPASVRPSAERRDVAAEGFALLFVRRYLTWTAVEPEADSRAMAALTGPQMEADAGMQPPAGGRQQVAWAAVVQERRPSSDVHVYTVAAQTDPAGLVYLSVRVARNSDGHLALAGYPAFVGPPAVDPALLANARLQPVEPALATVVARALRNYLARSDVELAADLTSAARVSLPTLALSLDSVQRTLWTPDHHSVIAEATAHDARGTRYELAYELDVVHAQGRWEIAAVQMDPTDT